MTLYKKGARKEYYLINKLKEQGFNIVQRTAGSHSPIDIIAIKIDEKVIKLVQSKRTIGKNMQFIDLKLKNKLENEFKCLNGVYKVKFEAL